MLFGNSEEANNHTIEKLSKPLYILVLATLIMYIISTTNINSTLVPRVCENKFARYYLFALLRAVVSSETKEANQTKRAYFIYKQHNNT